MAGFADATGHHLPLVCTLNATRVTDSIARLLGTDAPGLDELALGAEPGAGGVVLVPHLDGERTPYRPTATGTMAGIRADTTRQQLARAAVEGVVCNLLAGADQLVRLVPGAGGGRLLLIGGGSRSAAYRQVVANLTGQIVLVPDADEVVARGAAVQAAAVLTGRPFGHIGDEWGLGRGLTVEPDAGVDGAAVRQAYARALLEVGTDDR